MGSFECPHDQIPATSGVDDEGQFAQAALSDPTALMHRCMHAFVTGDAEFPTGEALDDSAESRSRRSVGSQSPRCWLPCGGSSERRI
mmetsp:Transcript_30190/g.47315  ORF Transcript_30190/g.47315 Transcript_30190/m.47315 type:complete len:87 (-) Transcript_30190:268-528(-)